MLNKLPNDETTVKMNLIKAINKDYVDVLRKVVHENNDVTFFPIIDPQIRKIC